MKDLHEDKLVPIVIDLNVSGDEINESFLRIFGKSIELVLKRMFGLNEIPFTFRGPKNKVAEFINTLKHEKQYIEKFGALGLNNPSTWQSKHKLGRAVAEFEKSTGIKWPLK
mgnify:CR=1 FL=1|jgi:hypothetical protein|tara:strand:- start:235 stop:570 length:336 start_codon:yes stop_codon:yes gene_type:complete